MKFGWDGKDEWVVWSDIGVNTSAQNQYQKDSSIVNLLSNNYNLKLSFMNSPLVVVKKTHIKASQLSKSMTLRIVGVSRRKEDKGIEQLGV